MFWFLIALFYIHREVDNHLMMALFNHKMAESSLLLKNSSIRMMLFYILVPMNKYAYLWLK